MSDHRTTPAEEVSGPVTPSSSRARVAVHVIWALVLLALAAVPVQFWWSAQRTAEGLSDELGSTLRAAFQGDVTHRFYSSGPELRVGDGLQLASLRMAETIERTHVGRFLGIEGRSQVRVDVPVTYHYQVPWDTGWRIVLTAGPPDAASGRPASQVCVVEAPALEPILPPAVHTDELRIDRSKDWRLQRFDQATVDSVLAEITPVTSRRALSVEYRTLVRETARRRLKDFLRIWVLQMNEVPSDLAVEVYVRFADDEDPPVGDGVALLREFEIR